MPTTFRTLFVGPEPANDPPEKVGPEMPASWGRSATRRVYLGRDGEFHDWPETVSTKTPDARADS